jgi:hypothetical protein
MFHVNRQTPLLVDTVGLLAVLTSTCRVGLKDGNVLRSKNFNCSEEDIVMPPTHLKLVSTLTDLNRLEGTVASRTKPSKEQARFPRESLWMGVFAA